MNALNVIDGVKAKFQKIAPSLPPGVEIVSGYDRSWLINESIKTLKRDLIAEAIIVSFVCIAFLFHFRSALVPIMAGFPILVGFAFAADPRSILELGFLCRRPEDRPILPGCCVALWRNRRSHFQGWVFALPAAAGLGMTRHP